MSVSTPTYQPTPRSRETRAHAPRRIAVFGSVCTERPPQEAVQAPASAARAVLERVFEQIRAQAPLIAEPILDRAVDEGKVTLEQRDELLRELADPQAAGGETSATTTRAGVGTRIVLREAFAAIRLAAPALADPILREAVADALLTPAQARRILERLRSSATTAFLRASTAEG